MPKSHPADAANTPSSTATDLDHDAVNINGAAPREPHAEHDQDPNDLEEEELDEEEVEGEGYESSSSASTTTSTLTWISWFCALPGHEYFCEVAEDFIEDDFNLTGLSALVPFYKEAMEMVLDIEAEEDVHRVPDVTIVESSAEMLYGLIHQRFIITRQGLQQMNAKFEAGHFGTCPRVYCTSGNLVPCGRSDLPGVDTVKLYCPSCVDMYVPPSSRFLGVDGAFFGTTFPHLLFQTYPAALPFPPNPNPPPPSASREPTTAQTSLAKVYIPRIYGFKVSERARSGPRMQWLRMRPRTEAELDWKDDDFLPPADGDTGAREQGAFGFGGKSDGSDDDDEEEEEEEEEEEDAPDAMKMSGVVGTPPTARNADAAATVDPRGRATAAEKTLMNDRVYRPLPAPRTSLPGPADSLPSPPPTSQNDTPLLPPPAATLPSSASASASTSAVAPSKGAAASLSSGLAEAVRRDVASALPPPVLSRPAPAHFGGPATAVGKATAV